MNWLLAAVVYFVIWWICLFAVLPLGVRSQAEEGAIVPGSEGGAPSRPGLMQKALVTTLVSALVFAVLAAIVRFRLIPLEFFSFLPHMRD